MSLGVGGCTPYSQDSNYATTRNYAFRDEEPYCPSAQTKMKCPGCGIWAAKGKRCTLCATLIPGGQVRRERSKSPTISSRASSSRSTSISSSATNQAQVSLKSKTTRQPLGSLSANVWPGQEPERDLRQCDHAVFSDTIGSFAATPLFRTAAVPMRRQLDHHQFPHEQQPSPIVALHKQRLATQRTLNTPESVEKVKCGYCGLWVKRGNCCALCRTKAN